MANVSYQIANLLEKVSNHDEIWLAAFLVLTSYRVVLFFLDTNKLMAFPSDTYCFTFRCIMTPFDDILILVIYFHFFFSLTDDFK